MVAGEQNIRHAQAVPLGGAAVLGIFQCAGPVALVLKAGRIGQHARHKAADGVRNGHGRDLTAGDDKVADGKLLVNALVDEALVDAFVMPADKNKIVHFCQTAGIALIEHMPGGGEVDRVDGRTCLIADMTPAAVERVCLQHGTVAAAVGIVVHLILPVRSVIPDLVRLDAENAALLRAAEDRLAQHVADGVREERHDINSHRLPFLRSGAGAHSPRQREFRGRIP